MKIAVGQLNPTVGDIAGNLAKLEAALSGAAGKADLAVFPELFLTGYPPRDLLEKSWFNRRVEESLARVAALSRRFPDTGILLGAPISSGQKVGKGIYNAALLFSGGEIVHRQAKTLLPSYDVFDETRYFDPAPGQEPFSFRGEMLGISICEDIWNDPGFWPRQYYREDPIRSLAEQGATLLINIAASPFTAGKDRVRFRLLSGQAKRYRIPLLYVNQVGGNDELIFAGSSFLLDREGEPAAVLKDFAEEVRIVETSAAGRPGLFPDRERIDSIRRALVLGISDYSRKCGFSSALIGLSGGIDSAVTAALAVEALGKENVTGITMPSPFTAEISNRMAAGLAANLGITLHAVEISGIFAGYLEALGEELPPGEPAADLARENIQARIRGNILMAFSNRRGSLVLSTGNKSEMATGYCTLYGDMSGGLAVLSDLPKTGVYELAGVLNREREVIPAGTIERPPSAELKSGQTDQDTLPPYPILDRILFHYIEENLSEDEIIARGLDPAAVSWTVEAVNRNEYKRRQAPPGLKVTGKAFGSGRRMPICARY
ncbi:MAG: NAD+ synthase [Candidatus Erginobacter occultus]|nr:NAD+ synthase [Candidatus Erginobacter occultus]